MTMTITKQDFISRFVRAQKTAGIDLNKETNYSIAAAMGVFMRKWKYVITDMGTDTFAMMVRPALQAYNQAEEQKYQDQKGQQPIQKSGVCEIIDNMKASSPDYRYMKKLALSHQQGIEFDLRKSEFVELDNATHCHYTGVELTSIPQQDNSRTLERIDPTKGYIAGNVVACCLRMNKYKGRTLDSWVQSSVDLELKIKMAEEMVRQLKEMKDNA